MKAKVFPPEILTGKEAASTPLPVTYLGSEPSDSRHCPGQLKIQTEPLLGQQQRDSGQYRVTPEHLWEQSTGCRPAGSNLSTEGGQNDR